MAILKINDNLSYSKWTLYILISILFLTDFNKSTWRTEAIIRSDVLWYYSYLPAVFIYKDISYSFIDRMPINHKKNIIYYTSSTGGKFPKMSMGLAYLYLPFFLVGHSLALVLGGTADGYSITYQIALVIAAFFYSIIALVYLRKFLLLYFSESVTSLTMITIFLGTNLFYYITHESGMSHAYNFCLFIILIYYSVKWHNSDKIKYSIIIGILGGLISLIRPSNILIMIIPFLYGLKNLSSINYFFNFIWKKKYDIILIIIIAFIIWLPQFLFWKYSTGNYLHYSYVGEYFYLSKPHIIDGLFGFRKGLFVYTPILLICFPGIILMIKSKTEFLFPVLLFVIINTYLLLSWWCWWFGGSYGHRAFIESFAILSLPISYFYEWLLKLSFKIKALVLLFIIMLISLNQFQTWQYIHGIIHWENMTRKAYWGVFLKTKSTPETESLRKPPDSDSAFKGQEERN
jgi:hypothetical protein